MESGDEVLLRGTVSPQNPTLEGEVVAMIECQKGSCSQTFPEGGLLVDLNDMQVVIGNSDVMAVSWPIEKEGEVTRRSLKLNDLMVSYGTVETVEPGKIEAELIFAGGGDAFRAEAKRNAILPKFLLVTSLFAAVVIALLPIIAWPEFG